MSWIANAYIKHLLYAPNGDKLSSRERWVLMLLSEEHKEETNEALISLKTLAQLSGLTVSGLVRMLRRFVMVQRVLSVAKGTEEKLGHRCNRYAFPEMTVTTTGRRPTDRQTVGATDPRSVGGTDRQTVGATDPRSVGGTDRQTVGATDPWSHASINSGEEKREEKSKTLRSEAVVVLGYLNDRTGKRFPDRTPNGHLTANLTVIEARLQDGYTAEQCRAVIDRKVSEWKGKQDREGKALSIYLRPATLFGPKNFSTYIGEVGLPAAAAPATCSRRVQVGFKLQVCGESLLATDIGRPGAVCLKCQSELARVAS